MTTLENLINECEKRNYTLSTMTGKTLAWYIHGKMHYDDWTQYDTTIYASPSKLGMEQPKNITMLIEQIHKALTILPLDGKSE